ncbi:MAG: phosphoribosyltransferase [Pseudomonadota bacterium]
MFDNREAAGAALAKRLLHFSNEHPIVYALPRGGLPVAAGVADALGAPLDIILVRKLGAPGHSELAIGAIVDGATPSVILHRSLIDELGVNEEFLEAAKRTALEEIERRRAVFLLNRKPVPPNGRVVIIVDDGLATGATMEAALAAMRKAGAKRVIVAVPVAPTDTAERFRKLADEFVCLETPALFWSVGNQYRSFPQLTDSDVIDILNRSATRTAPDGASLIA